MTRNPIPQIFAHLKSELPDITGLAIVTIDGLTVSYEWNSSIEGEKIGAVTAALLGLGKKAIEILSKGDFNSILLQSTESIISIYGAGQKALLVVGMRKNGNIGMLNINARTATKEIEQYILFLEQ